MQSSKVEAPVAKRPKKTQDERAVTPGKAFQRVDADIWSKEVISGLEDNSCKYLLWLYIPGTSITIFKCNLYLLDEGTFGGAGYGAKASSALLQVRGKDFRHEKTKKKRGAYRGGEITFESNSFKYDDDDE